MIQANFSEEALRENIGAFVNSLLLVKPAGLKKSKYILISFKRSSKFQSILNSNLNQNYHFCHL